MQPMLELPSIYLQLVKTPESKELVRGETRTVITLLVVSVSSIASVPSISHLRTATIPCKVRGILMSNTELNLKIRVSLQPFY